MLSASRWSLVLLALCLLTGGQSLLVYTTKGRGPVIYSHLVAGFGPQENYDAKSMIVAANPPNLCWEGGVMNATGNLLLALRGNCSFFHRAILAQRAGAIGLVIANNDPGGEPVKMGYDLSKGDDPYMIRIPVVSVRYATWEALAEYTLAGNGTLYVDLNEQGELSWDDPNNWDSMRFASYLLLLLPGLWCVLAVAVLCRRCILERRARFTRTNYARRIPVIPYHKPQAEETGRMDHKMDNTHVHNETCAICIEDFNEGGPIKRLPCGHGFHVNCIDPWLNERSELCPICKMSIVDALSQDKPGCWRAWCGCCTCCTCCNNREGYGNLVDRV